MYGGEARSLEELRALGTLATRHGGLQLLHERQSGVPFELVLRLRADGIYDVTWDNASTWDAPQAEASGYFAKLH